MAKRNSQWLGPKRRKAEFGSETGGTPRPDKPRRERKGFRNGAQVGATR